jgi:hypothetical protein
MGKSSNFQLLWRPVQPPPNGSELTLGDMNWYAADIRLRISLLAFAALSDFDRSKTWCRDDMSNNYAASARIEPISL